jgi:hypothetical protein
MVAALAGALAADAAQATGSPPRPNPSGLPIFFYGKFAHTGWDGAIQLVVSSNGRRVNVDGIAPGPCVDKDFGEMLPGRDGAAGPVFYSTRDVPIRRNGAFAISLRQAGRERPFKPTRQLTVTGTFSGNTVRGVVRALTTSTFDSCRASVRFTARRNALVVGSVVTAPGRRPPAVPGGATFGGVFHRALWGGNIEIPVSDDGTSIGRVQGILPGTCRERRTGRVRRAGPDGAIGFQFDVTVANAAVGPDGSFAVTGRNGSLEGGLPPATLTIRGRFFGNNVLGRVTGVSGKDAFYSSCRGNQPFWARRQNSTAAP